MVKEINMAFNLPTSEEILKIAPSLVPKIVSGYGKYWFVKSDPNSPNKRKIDLLAYELGKGICNVAEVKLLPETEVNEIRSLLSLKEEANSENTYLVRCAGTYSLSELACQNLEKAVATELAYSTWIRRRDTHALNREYNPNGIPVFYDSHIAFLVGEPGWTHSTVFLKCLAGRGDYGRPVHWRVKEIPDEMTTLGARSVADPYQLAWHYVHNIENFKKEMVQAETTVSNLLNQNTKQIITKAGFDPNDIELIYDFLSRNSQTLHSDLEEIMRIVLQP